MSPPIPRMSKNEARGNQRQSEAISFLSYRGHQRPSDAIRPHLRCNQTQSDAIRRNQTQSACPEHCYFPCFRVLGGPLGPVFCVFVFGAGTTGLCVLLLFLAGTTAQRACVLCFRVLADPPLPPSKHSTGSIFYRTKHKQVIHTILAFIHAGAPLWPSL